jgi:hypothetical protein
VDNKSHKLIVVILILNPSKYLFSMSKSTKRTTIVGANIILVPVLTLSIIAAVSNFSASQASAQTSSPTSSAKMHLDEGIKALQSGNTTGALMHLNAADKLLVEIHVPASAQSAKMHLDEGIKALQSGDTKGALMHLNAADQALGSIGE